MLFIAVRKVQSKNSQTSRGLSKNSHFQGVSSALEKTFQIQVLFKDFKDLHDH